MAGNTQITEKVGPRKKKKLYLNLLLLHIASPNFAKLHGNRLVEQYLFSATLLKLKSESCSFT